MFDDQHTAQLTTTPGATPTAQSTTQPGDVPAGTSGAAGASSPELGALSDQALEEALSTHAAHLAVAECRFVLMVAEVDRRELWATQGARSCAQWLSWRLGLSAGVGREHVRVGRALCELAVVRAAFEKGELSYSKVRALTRVASADNEATLVEMAGYATASQLDTIVAAVRRAAPDEGEAALGRHRGRYVQSHTDAQGMVVIRARLSPEDGACVLAAIEAARHELAGDEGDEGKEGGDVPAGTSELDQEAAFDPAARSADALVAICEAHRAQGRRGPFSTGPRASVVVHVDRQVLDDPGAPGCAHAEGVGVLSAHTVQRLLCDATVSTVAFHPDGTTVPEGRTRQVPDSLRRAVLTRDGGCRWPGCTRQRYVDVHHVVFVSDGGRTRLSNLVTVCRGHHRLVHEGGYRLAMDAHASVRVTTPSGAALPASPAPALPQGPDLVALHEQEGLVLDHHTMPTGGEPFDLDLTVDAILGLSLRAAAPS